MKELNTSISKIKNYMRTFNIIDENVLDVICDVRKEIYAPDEYKSFAYSDFQIPLKHSQFMLTSNVEGLILQSMRISSNDSAIILGSGTGYLAACVSKLASKVTAIDIYDDFISDSEKNCVKDNIKNVNFKCLDINDFWGMIKDYNIIISTFSIESSEAISSNMSENSKAFIFTGEENSPIKSGKIISKTQNNGYTREHIIQTNVKHIIKGLNKHDRKNT